MRFLNVLTVKSHSPSGTDGATVRSAATCSTVQSVPESAASRESSSGGAYACTVTGIVVFTRRNCALVCIRTNVNT